MQRCTKNMDLSSIDIFALDIGSEHSEPRLSLSDKGIDGVTASHWIEEVHTPGNIAFVTFSTGTSSIQNVIGVLPQELAARTAASRRALDLADVGEGAKIIVTYPPLVNLFPVEALRERSIDVVFPKRPSRDALISSMIKNEPDAVIGESSFLLAAMRDADKLSLGDAFSERVKIFAAGTPLVIDLVDRCRERGIEVHDLYGCQEFGWLALDGRPLRNDVTAARASDSEYEVIVGGLPTGDIMPVSDAGHVCCREGRFITYRRRRCNRRSAVVIMETTLASVESASRIAEAVVRLKGRIAIMSPSIVVGADRTVLEIRELSDEGESERCAHVVEGPRDTELFDSIASAQAVYQADHKGSAVWKRCRESTDATTCSS